MCNLISIKVNFLTCIIDFNKHITIIFWFDNTNIVIYPEGHTLGFESPAGTK
nr:MAG TPA: polo-box domain protein [Caudoviricetes sp.]